MEVRALDYLKELDFDNMKYYYHITAAGIGEKICSEGLLMADRHLWSTTIEITKDMLDDIEKFLLDERGNHLRAADEMVILGCNIGDENYMVRENQEQKSWNEEQMAPYIIENENILGYIDLQDDTLPLYLNEFYLDYTEPITR